MDNKRRYVFTVQGSLPPKKDGSKSMFGKPSEAKKLSELRRAASTALNGDPPLSRDIKLELIVHLGATNTRLTGDLDNFITGICDGLMAVQVGAILTPEFVNSDLIMIQDDSQVIEIFAKKVIGDTIKPWYEVTIEGY